MPRCDKPCRQDETDREGLVMEVTLKSRNKRVKRRIEQDHYWYDQVNKVMLHGRGGRMEFVYDPQSRRSIPRLVEHEEWVMDNNYEDIQRWIKTYSEKFGVNVDHDDGRNITLFVNVNALSDLMDDLRHHNIDAEYDHKEMVKERRGA